MRTMLLIVLVSGCASTAALENATYHAQACEAQLSVDQSPATAASCRAWRDQVAIEQARVEASRQNRQGAATVLGGMGAGLSAAGTPSTSRAVSCSSTTVGSSTFTTCN